MARVRKLLKPRKDDRLFYFPGLPYPGHCNPSVRSAQTEAEPQTSCSSTPVTNQCHMLHRALKSILTSHSDPGKQNDCHQLLHLTRGLVMLKDMPEDITDQRRASTSHRKQAMPTSTNARGALVVKGFENPEVWGHSRLPHF